jgi:hypothetical protein
MFPTCPAKRVLPLPLCCSGMQLEPIFNLPTRWPLVPVDVAAFFLDLTSEEIRLQADSLWAWDISAPGRERRELRIWRESLIAMKDLRRKIPMHHHEVLASFMPKRGLRGTELQGLLYCTAQHVAELDADRQIIVERNRLTGCGPNASKVYTRDSIVNFLKARSLAVFHPDSMN